MKKITIAICLIASSTACDSVAPQRTDGTKLYGAELSSQTPVKIGDLIADPEGYEGKAVTVNAVVRKACRKSGCWMEIADANIPEGQGCRVTFKDYGFLVPTNSQGALAKVEGVVQIKTISKQDVDHYESEGARFFKKFDDGSAREVHLVATGVELHSTVN